MTQEIVTKSILTVGQSLCLVQSRRLVGDACICILNGCTGSGCLVAHRFAGRVPSATRRDPTRRVKDSELAFVLWLFTLRCASWRCVAAGEVVGARGASLGGPYGAAKAHCCVAVDESRSRLPARCVSFYQIVCLSVRQKKRALLILA